MSLKEEAELVGGVFQRGGGRKAAGRWVEEEVTVERAERAERAERGRQDCGWRMGGGSQRGGEEAAERWAGVEETAERAERRRQDGGRLMGGGSQRGG